MLLSTIEVDPVNDWLDYTNAVLAGIAMFASVIAIVIALRAQKAADQAVAEERGRVFDLEILRELTKVLDDEQAVGRFAWSSQPLAEYRRQLDLLSSRLPFWDQLSTMSTIQNKADAMGLGEKYLASQERIEVLNRAYNRVNEMISKHSTSALTPEDFAYLRELGFNSPNEIQQGYEMDYAELGRISNEIRDRLGDKLAWDLQQAVLARTLIGRHAQPKGWRYLWKYKV